MNQSPPKPWTPGKHPTYSALQLVVNVCQDEHGNVWSDHDFHTPADASVAGDLPQGGAPQVAHALLTEAVRREAFMCALVELTKDGEYLARWVAADDEGKARMETDIGFAAKHVITQTLEKMVPGAVSEVLAMMADHQ